MAVLLYLLHLPTLTHFKVTVINDFVVLDLIPFINLKYLDIGIYTTLLVVILKAVLARSSHCRLLPVLSRTLSSPLSIRAARNNAGERS